MNECLVICRRGEIGKHRGLKIPWLRSCGFKSRRLYFFDFLSSFYYNYYMKRRYKKWLEKDWWSFSKCLKGGLRKWVEVTRRRHGAATINENQKRELRIIMLETGSKETLIWYFHQEPIKKFIALGIFMIMVGYALGKIIGIIVKNTIKKR